MGYEMSKDWTQDEINAASKQMKKQGELSYEEFLKALTKTRKEKTMPKQLMRNKETGQVVEFKGCLFNDNDCIIIFDDDQTIRYKNLDEFRAKWEKA